MWLLAAALVLAFPLRLWSKPAGRALLRLPATPVDVADPELASVWRFAQAAAEHVPAAATYTCRARDPVQEMNLHMVSLGLIRQATALPSSYYGRPLAELAGRARYVLVLGPLPPGLDAFEEVATVEGGVVVRRRGIDRD